MVDAVAAREDLGHDPCRVAERRSDAAVVLSDLRFLRGHHGGDSLSGYHRSSDDVCGGGVSGGGGGGEIIVSGPKVRATHISALARFAKQCAFNLSRCDDDKAGNPEQTR